MPPEAQTKEQPTEGLPNQNEAPKTSQTETKPSGEKTTLYDDLGVEAPGTEGSHAWPENWREQIAGDDEKALKALQRFDAPDKLGKSYLAAQQRISSGEYKRSAPKDATPEAITAWREENNIPATPADYVIPVPAGIDMNALDDGTKASIDVFRNEFHAANMPQPMADVVLKAVMKITENTVMAEAERDAQNQETLEDELRTLWGPQYRPNMIANLNTLVKGVGEDLAMPMLNARLSDGRRLADIPIFSRWLNEVARQQGNDVLVTGDLETGASVESQLDDIKAIMRTDIGRYRREGWDKKYGKLLEVQERRGKLK